MSLLIMLQVVSTEEHFENKKNFTIHIISISYYQLEWVQFEKNTMSGISKFWPKIMSYFWPLAHVSGPISSYLLPFKWAKIWLKYTNFFQIITSDYFQPNFWWIESYFTYFNEKRTNHFWTNIRNSNHSEKKKNPLKYITFS